jgi:hypothetical protein
MNLATGLQHQCVMIIGRPPLRVEGRPPLLHQVLRERLRQQLRRVRKGYRYRLKGKPLMTSQKITSLSF